MTRWAACDSSTAVVGAERHLVKLDIGLKSLMLERGLSTMLLLEEYASPEEAVDRHARLEAGLGRDSTSDDEFQCLRASKAELAAAGTSEAPRGRELAEELAAASLGAWLWAIALRQALRTRE